MLSPQKKEKLSDLLDIKKIIINTLRNWCLYINFFKKLKKKNDCRLWINDFFLSGVDSKKYMYIKKKIQYYF